MFNKTNFKLTFEIIGDKTLIESNFSPDVDCIKASSLLENIFNRSLMEHTVESIIKVGEKTKNSLQAETIVNTFIMKERNKLPQYSRNPLIRPDQVFHEWHKKINEND